jgi:ABC-type multidrug transport system ATPase subunit
MGAGKVLASGPPDELREAMRPGRSVSVRLQGGETMTFTVGDDEAQTALLRRLIVEEKLPIVEFTQAQDSLEDLFLHITEPGEEAT